MFETSSYFSIKRVGWKANSTPFFKWFFQIFYLSIRKIWLNKKAYLVVAFAAQPAPIFMTYPMGYSLVYSCIFTLGSSSGQEKMDGIIKTRYDAILEDGVTARILLEIGPEAPVRWWNIVNRCRKITKGSKEYSLLNSSTFALSHGVNT